MEISNSKRAIKGVTWSAIERFLTQGVQFVVSIILARLLQPSDFGLIALVLVVLNILQTINEVGFSTALMHKLNRDELDYSTTFFMNVFLGIVLYGVLFILAPYFATFFEQPQLTHLARLVGLNLIISSFIVVQRTKLFISVDFKTLAKASLIAAIISGIVGIYLAYKGFGIISLVYQSLLNNTINTLFIWFICSWRPNLQFSYNRFIRLFNFAYKLILARIINAIFQEAYSAVIGKVYSPAQLGFFNRANSFVQLSSNNITGIVQRVSTPILCEAQNDKQKMANILTKFITTTAFIVYPLLFGLFVLAEPIISVLITDKWLPASWILQVLCPVGLLYVISTFNRNIFNATGRTDWALKTEIIKKIMFVFVIVFAMFFGFFILVLSQVLIAIIEVLIDSFYTEKQIGLTLLQQALSVSGVFFASLTMAVMVWLSTYYVDQNIVKLLVGIPVGVITYLIICWLFDVIGIRTEKYISYSQKA